VASRALRPPLPAPSRLISGHEREQNPGVRTARLLILMALVACSKTTTGAAPSHSPTGSAVAKFCADLQGMQDALAGNLSASPIDVSTLIDSLQATLTDAGARLDAEAKQFQGEFAQYTAAQNVVRAVNTAAHWTPDTGVSLPDTIKPITTAREAFQGQYCH
jgi:hypothetical protein